MKFVPALLCAATAVAAAATPPAYDEGADARADIAAALRAAGGANQRVLLVFGANWCGDCKMLDMAFKSGATADFVDGRYRVVKVNVGRFDRNVDVAESYGVPLKSGIPAVVVLSRQGLPVFATRAGELADARQLGEAGILEFFKRRVPDAPQAAAGPKP
jgi:protein disulfide-isomerase